MIKLPAKTAHVARVPGGRQLFLTFGQSEASCFILFLLFVLYLRI